jgi:hypothetical protein
MKTFFTACLGATLLNSVFAAEQLRSLTTSTYEEEPLKLEPAYEKEPEVVISSEEIVAAYTGTESFETSLKTSSLFAPSTFRRLTPPFITEIEHERIIPGYPTEWDMAYFYDCTTTVGSAPELTVIPPFNWLFIQTNNPSSSRFHIMPLQKLSYGCTHSIYLNAPDCANLGSYNTVTVGDFSGEIDWAGSYDSASGGWYLYSVQANCSQQKWLTFQPLPGVSPQGTGPNGKWRLGLLEERTLVQLPNGISKLFGLVAEASDFELSKL